MKVCDQWALTLNRLLSRQEKLARRLPGLPVFRVQWLLVHLGLVLLRLLWPRLGLAGFPLAGRLVLAHKLRELLAGRQAVVLPLVWSIQKMRAWVLLLVAPSQAQRKRLVPPVAELVGLFVLLNRLSKLPAWQTSTASP
jgi:hypothetical protein